MLKQRGAKKVKEASPEDQFDPKKYKVGALWNYKNNKGDIKVVEIMGHEKGGVRVRYKGSKSAGWIVRKIGKLQDKAK